MGLEAPFGSCEAQGDQECREVSGLNLQWRANGNPGTIGRPRSSHIPSQASVAAHPSNHRRAVAPLNSPGYDTNPVSCYFFPSCLLCQSLFKLQALLLYPPFLDCLYISKIVDQGKTRGCQWHFLKLILNTLIDTIVWDMKCQGLASHLKSRSGQCRKLWRWYEHLDRKCMQRLIIMLNNVLINFYSFNLYSLVLPVSMTFLILFFFKYNVMALLFVIL